MTATEVETLVTLTIDGVEVSVPPARSSSVRPSKPA